MVARDEKSGKEEICKVMYDVFFEDDSCAGNLTERGIERIEESFAVKLDDEYLRMLKTCNGGVPIKKTLNIKPRYPVIDRFLCIIDNYREDTKNGIYDIEVVYSQIFDRMGDNIVPFATIFGGDMLCFMYSENLDMYKIVIWDHEASRDLESVVTYFVVDEFKDFIDILLVLDQE